MALGRAAKAAVVLLGEFMDQSESGAYFSPRACRTPAPAFSARPFGSPPPPWRAPPPTPIAVAFHPSHLFACVGTLHG